MQSGSARLALSEYGGGAASNAIAIINSRPSPHLPPSTAPKPACSRPESPALRSQVQPTTHWTAPESPLAAATAPQATSTAVLAPRKSRSTHALRQDRTPAATRPGARCADSTAASRRPAAGLQPVRWEPDQRIHVRPAPGHRAHPSAPRAARFAPAAPPQRTAPWCRRTSSAGWLQETPARAHQRPDRARRRSRLDCWQCRRRHCRCPA